MKLTDFAPLRSDTLTVVVGPTASGKTELAIALAERDGGEIVSADSVQIYQHFDIGSGKPTQGEIARAPHHLVGVIDPLEAVDAARFSSMADECIRDVRARGRHPIVCGGTFLWIRALVHGLAESPPADEGIRAAHKSFAEVEGRAALHRRLAEVDRVSAEKLAPNDLLRVSRALEVFELTGKPQSVWHDAHGFREKRFETQLVGALRERDEIDSRIRRRVVAWLSGGWEDEVLRLVRAGYGDARAMGSVGYRQMHDLVIGRRSKGELEEDIVRATRVFVRRQRTWIRDQPVTYLSL